MFGFTISVFRFLVKRVMVFRFLVLRLIKGKRNIKINMLKLNKLYNIITQSITKENLKLD